MLMQNIYDLAGIDEYYDLIIIMIMLVLTLVFSKMFKIVYFEAILILFVFIVTLLYSFELCSITVLIIAYFLLGFWLYIMINKQKVESIE